MKTLAQRLLFLTATVAATSAMGGVTFFESEGFSGQPLRIDGVAPDFRAFNFNDVPRSMVVERWPVEVCVHVYFGGNCQVFNPGSYPSLGIWSDKISSVRPAYPQSGRYQRHDPRGSSYYQSDNHRDAYYQDRRWGQERWNERRYRSGY